MYRACGLIKSDTDFTLDEAHARLAAKFPGHTVTRAGDQVVVSKGNWSIMMAVASGPGVRDETQGIVDKIAGLEQTDAEAYVATGRRVEAWSDDPDQFMEHFNEYLSVVEVLKTFRGLLAVDPREPGVL
ncbi:unnamed protein product [Gemmataceae bacterium]|nr:unnamed protein product [Gemmataceae bacterium]VTT97355.1 unnamed protein product [Gemmataceae bacterium]